MHATVGQPSAAQAIEGTWLDLQPSMEICVSMAPLLRLATLEDDGSEPMAVVDSAEVHVQAIVREALAADPDGRWRE